MTPEDMAAQNAGLRRRVEHLETENKRLREACELTIRTLDLCRDPTANPLAKIVDRERAERALRQAVNAGD